MNNNGSSSAIIARHDYLPFGEEIGAGLGLRTTSQGYGATDTNRQKYGLTERDDATGLDHTWWRKYENLEWAVDQSGSLQRKCINRRSSVIPSLQLHAERSSEFRRSDRT